MKITTMALLMSGVGNIALAEDNITEAINKDYNYLNTLFEYFHEHPELSFKETETAKRLGQELEALGFDVTLGVGQTGLVAMMTNGEGPTVLVRADMDGLPVEEDTGLSYASKARQVNINGIEMPVMHACGHDVHITSLVGTARRLVEMKDKWQGTLMLIGQPAEERIGGAKAMVEDGLYERFGRPDYALAFHVSAGDEAGKITLSDNLVSSSSNSVNIRIRGVATHGAAPHMGKDPIVLGSQIVMALQTLVSREISPLSPGVVTVGAFQAGFKHNIISDHADLQLTVRANSEEVRAKLLKGIKRIAENAGRMAGLPEDMLPIVELEVEATPTTYNDTELAHRLDSVWRDRFGDDDFIPYEQGGMGAEDFPYFTRVDPPIPGVYFSVGGTPAEDILAAKNGGPQIPSHHSGFFKIAPEPSIKKGVEAMTVAILELLPAGSPSS